jgi:hypothetical protein
VTTISSTKSDVAALGDGWATDVTESPVDGAGVDVGVDAGVAGTTDSWSSDMPIFR